MTIEQIMPLLVVATLISIIILFIRQVRQDMVEIIEEPNPDYLEQLAQGRTNLLNEVIEHMRLIFALTEETASAPVVEVVNERTHRITIASYDQIFTILMKWDYTMTISCYRNKKIQGKHFYWGRKTFRISNNCVNWKQVDKFLHKMLNKFMRLTSEDQFKELVSDAVELSKELDENTARDLLFHTIENFPWDGKKMKSNDAVKYFTFLLAYVYKFHAVAFLQYMKEQQEEEEDPKATETTNEEDPV